MHLELDPPSKALPAAISSIAATAKLPAFSAPPPVHKIDHLLKAAPTCSIEASPSFMFTAGTRRSSVTYGHEGFGQANCSCDQPMVVDVCKEERDVHMDES